MTPKPLRNFLAAALSIALAIPASAAPTAKPIVKATRTAANPSNVSTQVSQNIYRTEKYQDNYTVTVPYQEEEYYYEDVPYEDVETYTDWEEYWDWDRVCRDKTRYERVCKTERDCDPKYERRCETKQVPCRGGGHNSLPNLGLSSRSVVGAGIALLMSGSDAFADDDNDRRRRDEMEQRQREHEQEQRNREQERQREQEERQREHEQRQREQEERQREQEQRREQEREERRREHEQERQREREQEQRREQEREERRRGEEENRRRGEEEERRRRGEEENRRGEEERRRRDEEERRRRDEEDRRRLCPKEVCENVKVGETCSDKEVCRDVPHTDRVCKQEHVRKTRPVTKTRIVVKYRSERKSRWVTRYREETRCCVTKERQVFDHQVVANVDLNFPVEAELNGQEQETFNVELKNAESRPTVVVTPVKTYYTYVPKIQQVDETHFIVNMELVPTYKNGELGIKSLSGYKLESSGVRSLLTFVDEGIKPKVTTMYNLTLTDVATGKVLVKEQREQSDKAVVSWGLNVILTPDLKVAMKLEVARDGAVLQSPIAFVANQALVVAKEAAYNPAPYIDKTQVGKFSTAGQLAETFVYFRDLTVDIPQVYTEYTVKVSVVEKSGTREIGKQTFQRGDLKAIPDGRLPVSLVNDLLVSEADQATLVAGTTIVIEVDFVRYGSRFNPNPYVINKKVTLVIK